MGSSVIGALRVNLSIDSAEFKEGLKDVQSLLGRFDAAVTSAVKSGLALFAAGAAAGATALVALTKSSMDTISAQVDLANRVGASVAAIQTLEQAARLSGASQEALAKTLGTLNARLGEAAREGAGPAYEALQRLGLSARELSNMDADERIKTLSDRMKELGYNTQQQADTLRSLGVRQQEIINLFQEGSAAIESAREDLKAWGVLLSDVDAAKVEQAGDAWDKIGSVLQGVGNQLAVRLSPLIQGVADYLGDAAKQAGGFGDVIEQAIQLGIRVFHALNVEMNDFLRSIYEAGNALTNMVNDAAKPGQGLLRRILGMEELKPEEIGNLIDNIWKPLLDNLAKPPSMEEWEAWWAKLKKDAEDAVKAAAAAGRPGGEGDDGDGGQTEKQAQELAKYQEHLASKLAALQESLLTEREAIDAEYEERLAQLENFHNLGMISDEDYKAALIANQRKHTDDMKKLDDEVAKNNQRNAKMQSRAYFDIADNISSALTSVFGENKLVAIASAVINTAQAVTRTLAEYGATPLGFAAAAAAAAAGAAQIATIRSTSSKGGGGGGGGGGSVGHAPSASSSQPTQSAPAAVNQQAVHITLQGEGYSRAQVEGLVRQINDYIADGGRLNATLVVS